MTSANTEQALAVFLMSSCMTIAGAMTLVTEQMPCSSCSIALMLVFCIIFC